MGEIGSEVTRLFERDSIVLSHCGRPAAAAAARRAAQRHRRRRSQVAAHHRCAAGQPSTPSRSESWTSPPRNGVCNVSASSIGSICACVRACMPRRCAPNCRRHCHRAWWCVTPAIERGRAVTATRAYRVNLNMLALVALLTGAFLVFSTQSLAVLRRRATLGLLRALGVSARTVAMRAARRGRRDSEPPARCSAHCWARWSPPWCCVIWAAIWATVHWARSARYSRCDQRRSRRSCSSAPRSPAWARWIPAREAARRAPALAMKAGDAEPTLSRRATLLPELALIGVGAGLAWLPPLGGAAAGGLCGDRRRCWQARCC